MWRYESPIGVMIIAQHPNTKRYNLYFENNAYGNWKTAEHAADDIYLHVTSCDEWDIYGRMYTAPASLSEWERLV